MSILFGVGLSALSKTIQCFTIYAIWKWYAVEHYNFQQLRLPFIFMGILIYDIVSFNPSYVDYSMASNGGEEYDKYVVAKQLGLIFISLISLFVAYVGTFFV